MTTILDALEGKEKDDDNAIIALVAIDEATALDVFKFERTDGKHPIDNVLQRVRDYIDGINADVSTHEGRAVIRSAAAKISKAKTRIEAVGKEVADEQKKIPKRIDATRKFVKDTLDDWRKDFRQPLTDWEAAEDARKAAIEESLGDMRKAAEVGSDESPEDLDAILGNLSSVEINDDTFAEYVDAAHELRDKAVEHLKDCIERAKQREADAAELAALRAEAEKRKALEAEADAKAEEEKRLKAAAETEARLKREAEEAAEAKRAEDERRAKDVEHRRAVNVAAVKALTDNGVEHDIARTVVELIVGSKIPAISIQY